MARLLKSTATSTHCRCNPRSRQAVPRSVPDASYFQLASMATKRISGGTALGSGKLSAPGVPPTCSLQRPVLRRPAGRVAVALGQRHARAIGRHRPVAFHAVVHFVHHPPAVVAKFEAVAVVGQAANKRAKHVGRCRERLSTHRAQPRPAQIRRRARWCSMGKCRRRRQQSTNPRYPRPPPVGCEVQSIPSPVRWCRDGT